MSTELIVLIHAYMSSPIKLTSLRALVTRELPNADLYIPDLNAGWSSTETPVNITQNLLENIDQIWEVRERQKSKPYERIIFVGHSFGALIARKLYVCACGETQAAPFENAISAKIARPWAYKVERLILLAGMNRGWRVSHHLSLSNAAIWSAGNLIGNILSLLRSSPPLIFSVRKGAPFITQLRLHWIHMRNQAKERKLGDALTIQLLGSIDDMVSPEDNVDLISGRDFVYLDVPYSGHSNVIDMSDPSPVPDFHELEKNKVHTVGEARSAVLRKALRKSKDELLTSTMLPADLPPERRRLEVTDVVFVIHGIRDKGYWTHKVARRILELEKKQGTGNTIFATETSSYGYFPMLPFLLPSKRRKKVEWLMDQYAEALALYPNAKFSFIGHSNGTYLLARALHDYPACRFKNVLLAGSVVRTQYNWTTVISRGQVEKILNYVATADWVVAIFPRAIQMLRLQDLGSAGHDGFIAKKNEVEQIKFVKGGHGAALNEANWDAIARFIITGSPQEPPLPIKGRAQAWLVKIPGLVAPLIWLLIASIVYFIFKAIWSLDLGESERTLLSVGLGFLIWKVVTTV
ncbi:hypothetical protein PVT68_01350 [Microbulbifer bruguierae]|uniref:DUF676 domain-containing protein n=1 Tax=Microbulbifer bruguierae TaxID=3029061 RepID=A0ABY8NF01_9GAMM|nr:hypothetical protein [Microbulbifer bruguierae]WGL16959.1 hypothetical protein PVT68_01350 [Microbulbifer bruguierae]